MKESNEFAPEKQINAYEQAKKLFKEIENLEKMLALHARERNETIISCGKKVYDLPTQHITLRIKRAAAELAFIEREFFADFCRARRDMNYPDIELPPPLRLFAINAIEKQRLSARIRDFVRLNFTSRGRRFQ